MAKSIEFYRERKLEGVEAGRITLEIPKEWKFVKLKKICKKIVDGTHKTPRYVKKGIRFISTQNLVPFREYFDFSQYCKYISPEEHLELTKRCKPEKGDILVSKCGTIGRSQLIRVNFDFSIFVGLALLKLKKDIVCPEYLEQLLNFEPIKKYMETSSPGATRKTLTLKAISELKIPLPPLSEQRKIAHVLTTIDKAIEEVDKAIKKAERIKKGLMQELLTKGIGHKEFKDTEIGRIPKEWKVVKLGKIVEIYDNERIPLSETQRSKMKGDYPYCGANGILDHINDYIFEGEFILLAEDGGYWGKFQSSAYVMSGKFWANNHVHILKAIDGVANNRFLMYILNYFDLTPYTVGSTRGKLNQKEMRNIKVPLPHLEEQKKIAETLLKWDKVIELKKAKKEKLERMKKKVMELLLTGKVRVK